MRAVGTYGGIGARFAGESYRLRIILWDAQSAQSVWNVVTDSYSNDDARTDAEQLAELVASELKADGFVD